jgi:hypothetical protein
MFAKLANNNFGGGGGGSKSSHGDDNSGGTIIDSGKPGSYSHLYNSGLQEYIGAWKRAQNQDNFTGARPTGIFSKKASFVGSPNTTEIETTIAAIANSYISDKAPLLSGYMLGFQLLKKSKDDTKVCGIFAYKVGDELIYIPVFYLNGEVCGHELMYLVSRDQFVPSDEKWVNYLLSRKPMEPGKIELRDRGKIYSTQQVYSPSKMRSGMKLSSYDIPTLDPEYTVDALRCIFKPAAAARMPERSLADLFSDIRYKSAMFQLRPDTLFEKSARATKLAENWSSEFPAYGRLLDYVLDGKDITEFTKDWEKRAELAKRLGVKPVCPATLRGFLDAQIKKEANAPRPARYAGYARVYAPNEIPQSQLNFITLPELENMQKVGYWVADTRKEAELAKVIDFEDSGITNPLVPGLYDVFFADGTFKKAYVFSYIPDCCYFDEEHFRWMVILKEGMEQVASNVKSTEIWVRPNAVKTDWFDDLPSRSGLCENTHCDKFSRLVLAVSERGYGIECDAGCAGVHEPAEGVITWGHNGSTMNLTGHPSSQFNEIGSVQDNRDTYNRCKVYVGPSNTKIIEIKQLHENSCISLGTRSLWFSLLMDGTTPHTVSKSQNAFEEYTIDHHNPEEKKASLETLMNSLGLDQKTAEYVLELAAGRYPREISFRTVKTSAFSGFVPRDEVHPEFPEKETSYDPVSNVPIEHAVDSEEEIEELKATGEPSDAENWPGLLSSYTDNIGNTPQPNEKDMQSASQAAQVGQKDFVSSQMLMTLLREIDDDGIINKYIVVFEKACDALGRLYMQVLWRTDTFEERFGRTQLKEFREMIVALFQQLGDFICYLRQRDVRPSPVLSMSAVDIADNEQ